MSGTDVVLRTGERIVRLDPVSIERDYTKVRPVLIEKGYDPGSLDGSPNETTFEKEFWVIAESNGSYIKQQINENRSKAVAYYIKALQKVIFSTPEYARADLNANLEQKIAESSLPQDKLRELKAAAATEFLSVKPEFDQLNEEEKNVLVHCLLDPCGPCKISVVETWRKLYLDDTRKAVAFITVVNHINDPQINRTINRMLEDWKNGGSRFKPIELASN